MIDVWIDSRMKHLAHTQRQPLDDARYGRLRQELNEEVARAIELVRTSFSEEERLDIRQKIHNNPIWLLSEHRVGLGLRVRNLLSKGGFSGSSLWLDLLWSEFVAQAVGAPPLLDDRVE